MANELNIQPAPNWGGVPYAQGTTFGQPLSPYANLVDQIYAASQPMPTGMQFGRWAFGGGVGQTMPGQGQAQGQMPTTPPSGVGPQQLGGLLGGGQATQPQQGIYNMPPVAGFGTPKPTGAMPGAGASLTGSSPYIAAFNQLMSTQGPDAAYAYLFKNYGAGGVNGRGFGGYGGAGSQLEQQLGSTAFHQLANKYGYGTEGKQYDFSGLPGQFDARLAARRTPAAAQYHRGRTGLLGG